MLNKAFLMFDIIFSWKSIEMDQVKPSPIHDFFSIESIRIIPLHKFKDIILDAQYKKWENKIKKIWYKLTQEAFFEFMYKVIF
jgi:hypothetical protein